MAQQGEECYGSRAVELQRLAKRIEEETLALYAFSPRYSQHVHNLQVAISNYQEAQTPQNEQRLLVAAHSLIDYVKGWRQVQAIIVELLDAQVDKLALSLQSRHYKSLQDAAAVIYQTANDKLPLLEKEIKNLQWTK